MTAHAVADFCRSRAATAPSLIGQRFGRLVVQSKSENIGGRSAFLCICDCGTEKAIRRLNLTSGDIKSCGCLKRDVEAWSPACGAANRVHGQGGKKVKTSEYVCWGNLIKRCTNPKATDFRYWGGRGIVVCDRWRYGEFGLSGFECFFADMGRRPSPVYSIDRRDNDGNYEPGNCRWATRSEQQKNKRPIKLTRAQAEEIRAIADAHNHVDIAMLFGISTSTVRDVLLRRTWA
jgi:hypothetical protein